MNKTLIATLCAALFLGACNNANHPHDHDKPAVAEQGHGHDHGAGGVKITHYGDKTELFVEFPQLVVGEQSAFAAHLSTLSDFRALAAGKVTVILSGNGQPEESFSIEAPSQAGIFRPVAIPKIAGKRELTVEVVTKDFTTRHNLGAISVYPDRKRAEAEHPEEDEGSIGFTKEQQWKVDYATAEVATKVMRTSVSASGTLIARPDGEALMTAPAAGTVKASGNFPVLGQKITKGQILAYFAPRLGGDTDMASLQADARKAKVELDLASREMTRMEGLFKDEAVPEKRLFSARAQEASARATLEAADGRLGQYSGASGGIPLRSPVSGILVDVRATPGGFAQEGSTLFHVADRRVFWLDLKVPESDAVRLRAPTGATFRVDGIEQPFEVTAGKNGRLIAVGGAVDTVTRTVPVVFEFSQPDERLRIGMAIKGQVVSGSSKEVLAIPVSAVIDEAGIPSVFVLRSGESFDRQAVRLGARDGDWVEVIEGLEQGQRVVSRGAYLVKLAATKSGEIGHGHAH